MLDEFKINQKIVYRVLKNSIEHNKVSHAYLFETNGFSEKDKLVLSFAKALLCPHNQTNNGKCDNCVQCDQIDKNIYSELKIINPDGMWIKKEHLIKLQEEFKTKGLQSKRKVYIINNAECLNDSAANSILKFLEEPQDGIIAILVTDNIHQLLDTIISRCQVITLIPNINSNDTKLRKISNIVDKKYVDEDLENLINKTIDFIDLIENKKSKAIIYTKQEFFAHFVEKEDVNTFLQLATLLYKDAINMKICRNLELFNEKDFSHPLMNNSVNEINKKIQIIMTAQRNIKINANTNLLIDKLIIDLGDV